MLNEKKGTITLLGMYITLMILFLSVIVHSILMENYHYYTYKNNNYNLHLIENIIVKNIYDNYQNVNYISTNIKYTSEIKISNDDIHYVIHLVVYDDIYEYNAIYDKVCNHVLSFNNVSSNKKTHKKLTKAKKLTIALANFFIN